MYLSMREWKFMRFEKSKRKGKKYDAILLNNATKREIRMPFGQLGMEHYQDKTGLNLYPQLIHSDKVRRRLFKTRFAHLFKDGYYSSIYFSNKFLW